jgi:diaminopimelate epimerase
MAKLKLKKMNGIGNKFLILDLRNNPPISLEYLQRFIPNLSSANNQQTGGCDQFIVLDNSKKADIFMHIFNSDASVVDACGNASRCVGKIISDEKNSKEISIETNAGLLSSEKVSENIISVNMGNARFRWDDIPLSNQMDTLRLPIEIGDLSDPTAVSMGNPHMVFFVDDVDAIDVPKIGAPLEVHPLFPKKANVGFAEILSGNHIKLRVFERGVGETKACGTGACAALVAASRRGLTEKSATVSLPGGDLKIHWLDSGEVVMQGAVEDNGNVEVEI